MISQLHRLTKRLTNYNKHVLCCLLTDEDEDGNEGERDHTAAVRRCLRLYLSVAAATADIGRLEVVAG